MKMLLNLRQAITWIALIQIVCQGNSLKKSFRSTKTKSGTKLEHFKSKGKLKKEPIKNAMGKGKSSFDLDFDSLASESNYKDDTRNFFGYNDAENGLDKMHVAPVHEGHSVSVQAPHLKYDYKFDGSESNRAPHQSYAGEMIDEENTLSKFIAPPVFENHQNKLHEQEDTRMLYGTPEAQTAENANTKSLLNSLNSLMSPLSMSNFDEKPLSDLEAFNEVGKIDANEKSNIEYEGKYKVVNDEVERESEEYNHGDRGDSDERDERKFVADHGELDTRDRDGFVRESIDHHDNFDLDRDGRGRYSPYNERNEEYHSRKYDAPSQEGEKYDEHSPEGEKYDERSQEGEKYDDRRREDVNQAHISDTRSREGLGGSRFDGRDQQRYDNQRNDRNGKYEEEKGEQGEDKPIEVVQDDSGKLHPMSNSISKEELSSEVNKYMGQIPRN